MIDFVISRSKVIRENHVLLLLIFRKSFTEFSKDVGLVLKMIDYNKARVMHFGGLFTLGGKRLTERVVLEYIRGHITTFQYVNNFEEGYDHLIPIQIIHLSPKNIILPISWKHSALDIDRIDKNEGYDRNLLDLVYIECLLINEGAKIL